MDVEGQHMSASAAGDKAVEEPRRHMNRCLKRVLIVVNCLLLAIGNSGGPLFLRLYYIHGGHRKWLSTWLSTGGWPVLFLPLFLSYQRRRRGPSADEGRTNVFFITRGLFAASAAIGLLVVVDNFLYAYSFAFLPVSTSAVLSSTQLAFTAFFAFVIVRQPFTAYSTNAVVLLSVGAVLLGLHGSSDRPDGVTTAQYVLGIILILGAAALMGVILSLIELTFKRAKQVVTYTLVIEMQVVMNFVATTLCTVAMLINKDFQAIPKEASQYELGEVRYYVVIVVSAILWQLSFLGVIGAVHYMNTLFAGIILAMLVPLIEVLGVIIFKEKFSGEKGVSLTLALWGMASYSYGEFRTTKVIAASVLAAEEDT